MTARLPGLPQCSRRTAACRRDDCVPSGFQPTIEITGGTARGARRAVRWRRPTGTIIARAAGAIAAWCETRTLLISTRSPRRIFGADTLLGVRRVRRTMSRSAHSASITA